MSYQMTSVMLAISALALVASPSSEAATVSFAFDEGDNTYAQSRTFSESPFLLAVTASGVTGPGYAGTGGSANYLVSYWDQSGGSGLGVQSVDAPPAGPSPSDETTGSTSSKQIGNTEILWLTFNPLADFGQFEFVFDGPAEGAVFYTQNRTVIGGVTVNDASSTTPTYSVDYMGSVIGISHSGTTPGFRLAEATVSTVPLPPAAAAGAALLSGVVWIRRRRAALR